MVAVTHALVSAIATDPAATSAGKVTPTNWNANHVLANTSTTALLGSNGSTTVGEITYTTLGLAMLQAASAAAVISALGLGLSATENLSNNVVDDGAGNLVVKTAGVTNAMLVAIADGTIKSNISGGSASPSDNTISAVLDKLFGTTQGQVVYRGASAWAALAPGTSGQYLISGGAASNPSWSTIAASNLYSNNPADPTGTGSGTPVMCGLAGAFTPNSSGNVVFSACGNATGDIPGVMLRYGTGTAPANGAASTGTLLAQQQPNTGSNSLVSTFSLIKGVTGLSPGTTYWFDLSQSSGNHPVVIALSGISLTAFEVK